MRSSDLIVGKPGRYEADDDDEIYARTIRRVPRQEEQEEDPEAKKG